MNERYIVKLSVIFSDGRPPREYDYYGWGEDQWSAEQDARRRRWNAPDGRLIAACDVVESRVDTEEWRNSRAREAVQ